MRARASLSAALIAMLLAAGCSSGSPVPEPIPTPVAEKAPLEIMLDAVAALDAATSYRYVGAGLDVQVAGADSRASVTVAGGEAVLIRIDEELYLQAPAEYWSANLPADLHEALLPRLAGKFAKAAPDDDSFDGLLPNVFELLTLTDGVAKGETTTVNDAPAIVVTGGGRRLFVATEGEPYPLRLIDESVTLDFSAFGVAATIEAPADAFDLAALGGCSSRTRFACTPPEGTELSL